MLTEVVHHHDQFGNRQKRGGQNGAQSSKTFEGETQGRIQDLIGGGPRS